MRIATNASSRIGISAGLQPIDVFLQSLTVIHGPRETLATFFLKVTNALAARGLFMSFEPYKSRISGINFL